MLPLYFVLTACGLCRDHPSTAAAIAREVGIIKGKAESVTAAKERRVPTRVDQNPDHSIRAQRYEKSAIVVTGAEMNNFDKHMWNVSLRCLSSFWALFDGVVLQWVFSFDELIFARTTPNQKLTIVKEAQRCGHVVAVTGDVRVLSVVFLPNYSRVFITGCQRCTCTEAR